MCEEDYLGAAGGEGGCYDGADAGCSTLVFIMSVQPGILLSLMHGGKEKDNEAKRGGGTVIMMTLECMRRSEVLTAPPK